MTPEITNSIVWVTPVITLTFFVLWVRCHKSLEIAKRNAKMWEQAYYAKLSGSTEIIVKLNRELKSVEDKNDSLEKHLMETSSLLNKANAKLAYIYDSVETTFRSDFGEMKNEQSSS